MPSRAMEPDELLLEPATLPVTLEEVRVSRGEDPASAACAVTVSSDGVSWNDKRVSHSDIVLHGIAAAEGEQTACVYAQLENVEDGDVRFHLTQHSDIAVLFRALSAGAALAEDALRAEEARHAETPADDALFARRADGTVGPLDYDALLAVDPRFEDAASSDDAQGETRGDVGTNGNGER